jgi:hypothetical protein
MRCSYIHVEVQHALQYLANVQLTVLFVLGVCSLIRLLSPLHYIVDYEPGDSGDTRSSACSATSSRKVQHLSEFGDIHICVRKCISFQPRDGQVRR